MLEFDLMRNLIFDNQEINTFLDNFRPSLKQDYSEKYNNKLFEIYNNKLSANEIDLYLNSIKANSVNLNFLKEIKTFYE